MNDSWQNNSQRPEENGILLAEQEAKERCGICGKPLIIRTYLNPRDGRTYLLVECQAGHIRYYPPRTQEL